MAQVQITYWRNIPAMVTAREGRKRAKIQLPQRFQNAIDEAAMRAGLIGTDEYLEEWRRGPWEEREGSPEEVAQAVAQELEAAFPREKLRALLREIE